MTVPVLSGALLAGLCMAPAAAHSTPSILQMGAASERVSHGAGSACHEQRGIHVCGGAEQEALAGAQPSIQMTRKIRKEIHITRDGPNRRCVRGNFAYPGIGCRFKRRFTHGFYADRIARGL